MKEWGIKEITGVQKGHASGKIHTSKSTGDASVFFGGLLTSPKITGKTGGKITTDTRIVARFKVQNGRQIVGVKTHAAQLTEKKSGTLAPKQKKQTPQDDTPIGLVPETPGRIIESWINRAVKDSAIMKKLTPVERQQVVEWMKALHKQAQQSGMRLGKTSLTTRLNPNGQQGDAPETGVFQLPLPEKMDKAARALDRLIRKYFKPVEKGTAPTIKIDWQKTTMTRPTAPKTSGHQAATKKNDSNQQVKGQPRIISGETSGGDAHVQRRPSSLKAQTVKAARPVPANGMGKKKPLTQSVAKNHVTNQSVNKTSLETTPSVAKKAPLSKSAVAPIKDINQSVKKTSSETTPSAGKTNIRHESTDSLVDKKSVKSRPETHPTGKKPLGRRNVHQPATLKTPVDKTAGVHPKVQTDAQNAETSAHKRPVQSKVEEPRGEGRQKKAMYGVQEEKKSKGDGIKNQAPRRHDPAGQASKKQSRPSLEEQGAPRVASQKTPHTVRGKTDTSRTGRQTEASPRRVTMNNARALDHLTPSKKQVLHNTSRREKAQSEHMLPTGRPEQEKNPDMPIHTETRRSGEKTHPVARAQAGQISSVSEHKQDAPLENKTSAVSEKNDRQDFSRQEQSPTRDEHQAASRRTSGQISHQNSFIDRPGITEEAPRQTESGMHNVRQVEKLTDMIARNRTRLLRSDRMRVEGGRLGTMDVQIRENGDTRTLHIYVENDQARVEMQKLAPSILNGLQNRDIPVAFIQVEHFNTQNQSAGKNKTARSFTKKVNSQLKEGHHDETTSDVESKRNYGYNTVEYVA